MEFKERSYSVLLVSAAENFNTSMQTLLPDLVYPSVRVESSVSAAKRTLLEREFDFVLINSPLPDEDGIRFAIDVCGERNTVVLLFIRNELYHDVFEKVSVHGVFTLPKPTSRQTVLQALDWMGSARERLHRLAKKTLSLEDKMQEIRIVNRAKWLLISELKMSEAESHRYIEKQAMNRCASKRIIAEGIITKFGREEAVQRRTK